MSSSAEKPGKAGSGRSLRRLAARGLPVIAGVAVLGLFAQSMSGGKTKSSGEPAKVHREDLVLTVESTGELAAVRTTDIGPPVVKNVWDFKISFLAPESKAVKRGQPILGFETTTLEKQLEEKKAELAEATKQIEKREIDLSIASQDEELAVAEAEGRLSKSRLKVDIPEELSEGIEARTARLDLEASQKELSALRAKLESTKAVGEADLRAFRARRDRAAARVAELQESIEGMTVKASQDGILIYKTGWRDEKKKVGDSTWAGEKVLELPDLTEMKAVAEVDEADAGRISVGGKATIRLEAHPDLDFTGRVRAIGRTVQRKGWRDPNKVYKVEIVLDKTDATRMRPAMRFRGEIETGRVGSLLLAPREAVFLRPSGTVVWVKRATRMEESPVTLGRSNKRLVEIVSGLAEGDLVSLVDLAPPKAKKVRAPVAGASNGG